MIAHHVRYLWYLIAGTSAMGQLRLGQHWWDDDYRRGGLKRTHGEVELPRHLLIAALARHYAVGGSMLDVGCGTGALAASLRRGHAGIPLQYVGLDISSIALAEAATAAAADAGPGGDDSVVEYVQADFEEYLPDRTFDVVIFSESLYYAADPVAIVARYASALNEGGIIIISMWRRHSRVRVWRRLNAMLRELSSSRLVVPLRPAWDIVAYARPEQRSS